MVMTVDPKQLNPKEMFRLRYRQYHFDEAKSRRFIYTPLFSDGIEDTSLKGAWEKQPEEYLLAARANDLKIRVLSQHARLLLTEPQRVVVTPRHWESLLLEIVNGPTINLEDLYPR
jgi:hypothetical protein